MGEPLNKKCTNPNLRRFLDLIRERPSITRASRVMGLGENAFHRWRKQSEAGKLEVELDHGVVIPFHEAFNEAWTDGHECVKDAALGLALGEFRKVLTFNGQVTYVRDELTGEPVRDADGNAVPATVPVLPDIQAIKFLLNAAHPETYRDNIKVEHGGKGLTVVMPHPLDEPELRKWAESMAVGTVPDPVVDGPPPWKEAKGGGERKRYPDTDPCA
jgi:hypothetical protein